MSIWLTDSPKRYDVTKLVYYEAFGSVELAISREKQLKNWRRSWKVQLIERDNLRWNDLYETLI